MIESCICEQGLHFSMLPLGVRDLLAGGAAQSKISGTVLVIDDEEVCRQAATILLRSLFDKIVTVSSAEEAIKYLYESSKEVTLILSDIDLPQMSGLEFLSEIKQHRVFRSIPVIMQTGCVTVERRSCLDVGASGFLQKPYTQSTLYKAIKKLRIGGLLC